MSEAPAARRSRRWKLAWRGPLGVAGVLLALFGIWHAWLGWQVNSELAAIRAAGYPATLAELEASHPPLTGRNAAQVYEQAFAAHQYDPVTDKAILLVGDADLLERRPWLDAAQRDAARAFLARNAEARRLVSEAVAIDYCRWSVDMEDPWGHRPQLYGMRSLARLLELDATLFMYDGEHEQALRNIADMKRIGDALRYEPLTLGRLVQMSVYTMAIETMERLLAERAQDAERIAALHELLDGLSDDDAILRTVASERAWGSSFLADPAPDEVPVLEISGCAQWNRLVYLREMAGVMNAVEQEGLNARPHLSEDDLPVFAFLAWIVMPAIDDGYRPAEQRFEMHRRAALVALAVERYRLAHGDWPARLDELVPNYLDAVPMDVFDAAGGTLRYAVQADRAVIYSVGGDGVDNSGREADPQARRGRGEVDIAFTLWHNHDEREE